MYEFFDYKKTIIKGIPRSCLIKKSKINKIRIDNIYRSKSNLKRLIYSNPDLNKFLTLTFADHITDLSNASYFLRLFLKKLKYRFPFIKYVIVPEFTKNNRVHYHILINLPYIKSNELADIWGQGFIKLKKVYNTDLSAIYLTKYLSKKVPNNFFNHRRYYKSNNLVNSLSTTNESLIKNILQIINKLPFFIQFYRKFINCFSFIGEVQYKKYIINHLILL